MQDKTLKRLAAAREAQADYVGSNWGRSVIEEYTFISRSFSQLKLP